MTDWVCVACGARWAPGAPRCPECPSTEHVEVVEVPKILPNGQVTYEADVPRGHPGYGVEMHGTEAPADGTEVTITQGGGDPGLYLIDSGDFRGPEGLEVLKVAAEGAQAEAPAPEPAVHVPPKPPRRAAPPGGGASG